METPNNEQITAGVLLEGCATLADDKVRLKLEAIDTIAGAAYKCESVNVKDEVEALAQAVMKDLGFEWNHDNKMYDYNPNDDPFSDEL